MKLLQEYVIIELNLKKDHLVAALYRLPKQLQNRFCSFETIRILIIGYTTRKTFLTIFFSNVNVKNKHWLDRDSFSNEILTLNGLIAQYSLTQSIQEPTHILKPSFPIIELISNSQ